MDYQLIISVIAISMAAITFLLKLIDGFDKTLEKNVGHVKEEIVDIHSDIAKLQDENKKQDDICTSTSLDVAVLENEVANILKLLERLENKLDLIRGQLK